MTPDTGTDTGDTDGTDTGDTDRPTAPTFEVDAVFDPETYLPTVEATAGERTEREVSFVADRFDTVGPGDKLVVGFESESKLPEYGVSIIWERPDGDVTSMLADYEVAEER